MTTLREEFEKYVAPFIKEPGSVSKDPVVAAIHLTNCRWMEAMGQNHHSRTDPEFHVKIFRERIQKEARESNEL